MCKPSEQGTISDTAGRSKASWSYSNVPTFVEYKQVWIPTLEQVALKGCYEAATKRTAEVPSQAPERP